MLQLSTFHFSMSQNRIQKVSMKKTPWTIQIVPKKFWLCMEKKQSPTSIHEKTQTPWTIHEKNQIPWTIWFFYGFFKNIEFFCHFFIFQKNWQCLALCSCQGYRLIIAGCKKNDCVLKNTNTLNYPILVGYFVDLAKFSQILEIFIKKVITK